MPELKFKTGEVVMVIEDAINAKGVNSVGRHHNMIEFAGKPVTILDGYEAEKFNRYIIEEDNGNCWFTEDMFIPIDKNEAFTKLVRGEIDTKTYDKIIKEVS